MGFLKTILGIFFLINAIFWGLFPHATHCAFVAKMGVLTCPSHWIHISLGILCFLVTVLIFQWNMFFPMKM